MCWRDDDERNLDDREESEQWWEDVDEEDECDYFPCDDEYEPWWEE